MGGRVFDNAEWLAQFNYNYKTVDEIPQRVFDTINGDLSNVVGLNPLVSIVIPAWNEEVNILRCIASLSKTKYDHPIEIIVVNNNSSDRTQETLEKLNVRCLFEKIQGGGPARQLGQENANGKFVLLADADCLYPSCWVKEMINVLDCPEVVCVYGRYSFISERGFPRWQLYVLELLKDLVAEFRHFKKPYLSSYGISMGYIRDLGLKVGFIKTNFRGEDGQLCLGLMKYGKVKQVRSSAARVWTGPRTLQRDGNLGRAFRIRITREARRLLRHILSKS